MLRDADHLSLWHVLHDTDPLSLWQVLHDTDCLSLWQVLHDADHLSLWQVVHDTDCLSVVIAGFGVCFLIPGIVWKLDTLSLYLALFMSDI